MKRKLAAISIIFIFALMPSFAGAQIESLESLMARAREMIQILSRNPAVAGVSTSAIVYESTPTIGCGEVTTSGVPRVYFTDDAYNLGEVSPGYYAAFTWASENVSVLSNAVITAKVKGTTMWEKTVPNNCVAYLKIPNNLTAGETALFSIRVSNFADNANNFTDVIPNKGDAPVPPGIRIVQPPVVEPPVIPTIPVVQQPILSGKCYVRMHPKLSTNTGEHFLNLRGGVDIGDRQGLEFTLENPCQSTVSISQLNLALKSYSYFNNGSVTRVTLFDSGNNVLGYADSTGVVNLDSNIEMAPGTKQNFSTTFVGKVAGTSPVTLSMKLDGIVAKDSAGNSIGLAGNSVFEFIFKVLKN